MTFVSQAIQSSKDCAGAPNPFWDRVIVIVGWIVSAGIAYWLGLRQKESDRKTSFYTDAVVTPCVAEVNRFFDTYRDGILELLKNPAANTSGATVPRIVSKFHLEFSLDLRRFGNTISGRIEAFDLDATSRFAAIIDQLDDDMTALLFSKKPKDHKAVMTVLMNAKRSIIQVIYKADLGILD